MDSPPTAGANSLSQAGPSLPPSELASLSAIEVSQIQTEIANELFGFAPLTFTSRVVDLANEVIYNVIDKIELEVNRKWAENVSDSEESSQMVAKGVNRLETLLMGAVDIRFDQAETWLVRNTFKVPVELVPYILLPNHPTEGFTGLTKPGQDDALMKELEQEIAQINGQREELALLDSVEERLSRRIQALKKMKSELSELSSAGGARDTLSVSSKALALSMPSYISQCRILLSTSSSLAHPSLDTHPSHAWKHSREAYLSWVTDRVLEVSSNSGDLKEERMDAVGSASDARALKSLIAA